MLRLGMTNPPFILEHLPEVADILQDHRVFSYLHVPVRWAEAPRWTDPPLLAFCKSTPLQGWPAALAPASYGSQGGTWHPPPSTNTHTSFP